MTPDELKEAVRLAEAAGHELAHADPLRDAAEDAAWADLQARHPGEFVAFRDAWDGTTFAKQVLAHGPNRRTVREQLAALPDAELEGVTIAYLDPPAADLCTRATILCRRPEAPKGRP